VNAVSDTGPLIALAKINQLALLQKLFDDVYIPPTVHWELLAKHSPESVRLDKAIQQGFIQVTEPPVLSQEAQATIQHLDKGEQAAIALAHEKPALLIIDERLGRSAARKQGLTITGVVGLLIQAKRAGYIPQVLPLLHALRERGYWLSDRILKVAAKQAGEH
jgi:hypothetical protein